MDYTYEDFVTEATKEGMMDRFSETDLATAKTSPEYGLSILSLMKDEKNATTAEQRLLASEAMNLLRKNYGVQSQIAAKENQIKSNGSFVYGKENAYQEALKNAAQVPEFSYDKENDPVYQSMRQTAIRDSQRAVEDTLARASVGTGGVPSSYAITAAQQAANNYTGSLADAVPTLYQNALAEHQNKQSMALKSLSALQSDKQTEYEKYLDGVKLLNSELAALQGKQESGAADYAALLAEIEAQKEQGGYTGVQKEPGTTTGGSFFQNLGNAVKDLFAPKAPTDDNNSTTGATQMVRNVIASFGEAKVDEEADINGEYKVVGVSGPDGSRMSLEQIDKNILTLYNQGKLTKDEVAYLIKYYGLEG